MLRSAQTVYRRNSLYVGIRRRYDVRLDIRTSRGARVERPERAARHPNLEPHGDDEQRVVPGQGEAGSGRGSALVRAPYAGREEHSHGMAEGGPLRASERKPPLARVDGGDEGRGLS